MNLGLVMQDVGLFARSGRAYLRSQEILEGLAGRFPDVPEYKQGVADATFGRANLLDDASIASGRPPSMAAPPPFAAGPRDRVARAVRRAIAFARAAADRQEGERAARRAVALHGELADKFPKVPDYRLQLGNTWNTLVAFGPADAEEACRRSVAIYKGLMAEDADQPAYRKMLAVVDINFAGLLPPRATPSEAEARYVEAGGQFEALIAAAPTEVALKNYLGGSWPTGPIFASPARTRPAPGRSSNGPSRCSARH